VEIQVVAGTITSSPGPIPKASRAISIASVPLAQPTQWDEPFQAAKASSKRRALGPEMKAVEAITSAMAASNSAWISRYWTCRSWKGTVTPGGSVAGGRSGYIPTVNIEFLS
jgi:hypothetical protein